MAAYFSTEPHFSGRAQQMVRNATRPQPLVPLLLRELRSQESSRRELALKTVLQIASPEVVRAALGSLQTDEHPEIRRWAAERLKAITIKP